ncbi:MAG TPA: hypothetical protein PKV67_16585 [Hyphomonas sp.]|nr:hypothetical protein [Hyphomonas sp.]HRK67515.1 hypothetical protein [Hyphomonas sp.]
MLNYGLGRALGEHVIVYEAEDRPHPDQLKAAVRPFRAAGKQLACVQAPLVGRGAASWIGRHWALGYAVQFGRLLPAQAKLGLPVMLGGTSNYFRRSARSHRRLGRVECDRICQAWLAPGAQRVGMIRSPTLETPPGSLIVWVNQCSRWMKGFIQTCWF